MQKERKKQNKKNIKCSRVHFSRRYTNLIFVSSCPTCYSFMKASSSTRVPFRKMNYTSEYYDKKQEILGSQTK